MEGDDRHSRRSRGNTRKRSSSHKKGRSTPRTKSGCYTCRIRRKKCDEMPDTQGHCQNCVRLHLECLGFGEKRPDWLRDPQKVVDIRERIKNFLSSRGMIKGVGHGRDSEAAPAGVLRLSDVQHEGADPTSNEEDLESTFHVRRHSQLYLDPLSQSTSTSREINDDHHDWRQHSNTFDPYSHPPPTDDHRGYHYSLASTSHQESLSSIDTLNPPVYSYSPYTTDPSSYDHNDYIFEPGPPRQLPSLDDPRYSSHSSSSPGSASETYSSFAVPPTSTLRQHSASRTSSRASERGHIGHSIHTSASGYPSPSPEVAAQGGAIQETEESMSRLSFPLTTSRTAGKRPELEPSSR